MDKQMVLFLCLLTITLYTPAEVKGQLSEETVDRINTGLDAGKDFAETLKDGNFRRSLVQIGTKLGPFLNVLGPLASVVFSFLDTGDSQELAFMKKKFKEVNNKLDEIIAEFDEVKKAIDWKAVEVSYGVYERKIRALEEDLNRVYSVPKQAFETEKNHFLDNFKNDFDNSLQKLYDAIMNDDHVFSKNILDAAIKNTENHKRKVERFSLGLVQILVEGIEVQLSYYALGKKPYDHVVKEWMEKMKHLCARLQEVSVQIKNTYKTQMNKDVKGLIRKYHKEGNRALMWKIYNFATDKFDWRYWFVAVYNDMVGHDKHTIYTCGGDAFLHTNEKNIIVSSQDKKYRSRFKAKDAEKILKDVEGDVSGCKKATRNASDRAKTLVGQMQKRTGHGCVPYALTMAQKRRNGLWYVSWKSHRVYKKIDKVKVCKWDCSWWGCRRKRISWSFGMMIFG